MDFQVRVNYDNSAKFQTIALLSLDQMSGHLAFTFYLTIYLCVRRICIILFLYYCNLDYLMTLDARHPVVH